MARFSSLEQKLELRRFCEVWAQASWVKWTR